MLTPTCLHPTVQYKWMGKGEVGASCAREPAVEDGKYHWRLTLWRDLIHSQLNSLTTWSRLPLPRLDMTLERAEDHQ